MTSEVATLIVGDGQQATCNWVVIIEEIGGGLRRITKLHPSFMAMQYSFIFPYGENGFRIDIPLNNIHEDGIMKKKKVCQHV